jgi:carbon-monoxide dehydrogenase large subunit
MVHSQARVIAMSLEPRAVVAQWDACNGMLTAWLSTQTPARARTDIANTLGLPTSKVRVIAPDVGGAFGAKETRHGYGPTLSKADNKQSGT